MKTESAVAAPMAPNASDTDAQRLLRIIVVSENGSGRAAEMRLSLELTLPEKIAAPHSAELTLHGDGGVSGEQGMDILGVEDQLAVRAWLAQFAMAGIFPAAGVRLGEKWKAEEAVANAALAGLVWEKEYTYVRDEVCPVNIPGTDNVQEMCAVILTRETLKQKSSVRHATPEDFKAHDLRTEGTAHGANEIVAYFSLKKGVLVRGTEEARQSMDAGVALANHENRVHYYIDGQSHTEILLVENTPNK